MTLDELLALAERSLDPAAPNPHNRKSAYCFLALAESWQTEEARQEGWSHKECEERTRYWALRSLYYSIGPDHEDYVEAAKKS